MTIGGNRTAVSGKINRSNAIFWQRRGGLDNGCQSEKLSAMLTSDSFVYRLFIGVPSRAVWRALTTKALVDRYYLAPLLKLEPKAGGAIAYGRGGIPIISGEITEIAEPVRLAHTFRFEGIDDPASRVTYDLAAVGEQMCELTITHSALAPDSPTFANIVGGWPVIASSLKTLLETGEPLPWL